MSHVYRAVSLALRGERLRCNAPEAIYDWAYGPDVGAAIRTMLATPMLSRAVYNLAGEAVSMRRLLSAVAAAVPTTRIDWGPGDTANLPVSAGYRRAPLDIDALRHDTDYQPSFTLEAGISHYVGALRLAGSADGDSEEGGRT
jgi:nucleoside-diphosphate-sugar epimerase